MEAFINTTAVVALGEMGDKTQVLALLLAIRYQRILPIITGIFIATLLTMGLTALVGTTFSSFIPTAVLRWLLVAMFLGIAVWTLIPEEDDDDDDDEVPLKSSTSLIITAFTTFLVAELGDKSQIATLIMAAKYGDFVSVVSGATVGEMLAIMPAVLLGKTTAQWIPLAWVRVAAACVFAGMGIWIGFFGME
ncbi:MAG: TMEM165/GDT1 family protein [Oxalobacteraceae bacterium]|jgi:putative Ca2+/H+ antiporter (TMEM165/GDT1 family)|nr:TMEM165/GDT1 family protein [Oxalobacteraceae bacterium]